LGKSSEAPQFSGNGREARFGALVCAKRAKMAQIRRGRFNIIICNPLVISELPFCMLGGTRAAESVSAILWLRF
jgi:hypothetical protein